MIGEECWAKWPCHACSLLWDANDISGTDDFSDMAHWSLTTSPVPGIPPREFKNLKALRTIQANPHLFQVNCTLNIACLQELLVNHLNQALIESICHSLHEGYWPYADTKFDDVDARYPTTLQMDRHLLSTSTSFTRKSKSKSQLAGTLPPLGLIYCQECTPCLSMQYPSHLTSSA